MEDKIKSIKIDLVKTITLSKKEYDLIMFIRNEMPFGEGLLITYNGQPSRVEDRKKHKIFGEII